MICQPCQADTHDNCTIWTSTASLGMRDRCSCGEVAEVHVVLAKPAPRLKGEYDGWTDGEIRNHKHDTGEEEFDTWIADSARELEEIGG